MSSLEAVLLEDRFYGPGLRFCLERIGTLDGRRILELGCARGELSVLLALRGARLTGIDVRGDAVAEARLLAARHGVGDRCRFAEADAH